MGALAALVKGGHIEGEPVDVLYDGQDFRRFLGTRIEKNMHGTGCVLSSAIAARLALGDDLPPRGLIRKRLRNPSNRALNQAGEGRDGVLLVGESESGKLKAGGACESANSEREKHE